MFAFFGKMPVHFLCQFLNQVVCLSYIHSFYILGIYPLPEIWFTFSFCWCFYLLYRNFLLWCSTTYLVGAFAFGVKLKKKILPRLMSRRPPAPILFYKYYTFRSCCKSLNGLELIFFFFHLFFSLFLKLIFFTLQYCIGFAIHWLESTMSVHVFPILIPPPISLLIPSLWVFPVPPSTLYHASNLDWRFVSHDILHVSMPFSHIILPSPSPTESKRLFSTSVSLLLSCIQGYHFLLF